MKYKLFASLLCMAFSIPGFGQTPATIRELHEGDTLPNIAKVNFLRGGMPEDFSAWCKDKLVLLDFWATWCGPCVEGLPFMDSLQKQFNGLLEVVPVAYETKAKIASFVAGKPEIQGKGLSYVTEDTLFSKLFPHNVVPHIVWLLSGKVIAITGHEAVSFNHVQQALKDAEFKHYVKSEQDELDLDSPLVFESGDIVYRSILSNFKYGWPYLAAVFPSNNVTIDPVHRTKRVAMINLPISMLYIYAAYNLMIPRQNKQAIILEIKDTFQYCHPRMYWGAPPPMDDEAYLDWQNLHAYCYELIVPDTLDDAAFGKIMMDDLNRFFAIKGVIEKRKRFCYVIKNATATSKKLKTVKMESNMTTLYPNSGTIVSGFEAVTIDQILAWLNQLNRGYPILNETVNREKIDLYFNFNSTDLNIEEIKAGFEKNGFKMVKVKRRINTLVLKDK